MSYQLFMELMAILKKRNQDLWIENAQFAAQLLSHGYTQEQLHQIAEAAKLDPEHREQARVAFREFEEALDTIGKEAVLEALAELPPPSGNSS